MSTVEGTMRFRAGDLVEVVQLIPGVELSEAESPLRGNMAVQFVNSFRGVPFRVRAVNEPYIVLKRSDTSQKIFADLRLVEFRRLAARQKSTNRHHGGHRSTAGAKRSAS